VIGIPSYIAARHSQLKEKINDSSASSIGVDAAYDHSLADPEPLGQLMRMNRNIQRGTPQCLRSVFEDIVKSFPNPNENQRLHETALRSAQPVTVMSGHLRNNGEHNIHKKNGTFLVNL
jgi:hypothetical protein